MYKGVRSDQVLTPESVSRPSWLLEKRESG